MRRANTLFAWPAGRVSKWLVLVAWLAMVVGLSPLAAKAVSVEQNDAAAWLPNGAQSTKVLADLEGFPGAGTSQAVVIYHRDGGLRSEDRALAERHIATLSGRYTVEGAAPPGQPAQPVASSDGQAVTYSVLVPNEDGAELLEEVKEVREIVGDGDGGLTIKVAGPAGALADSLDGFAGLDVKIALATLTVVAVLLLITYRSPFLWLLPLIIVGLASQVASAAVYGLVKGFDLTINSVDNLIMIILVFGAGTDYALLLIARYREELRRTADKHVAMKDALTGAGPAILASAATVTIGLLCLLAANLQTNRGLGPVGAAGIVVALAAMLTLLPALLTILGRWVFWPFIPREGSEGRESTGFWSRVGHGVARRPRVTWIATSLALGVVALGLFAWPGHLKQEDQFRTEPDSVVGQRLISESFPSGTGRPALIVSDSAAGDAVLAAVNGTSGVADAQRVADNEQGTRTLVIATLDAAPDSTEEREIIERIRDRVDDVRGAEALVGGEGAQSLDLAETSQRDQAIVIPLVLAVVLIVLMLLLRALVAPVVLIATVVLSFAATLGVSGLVFTEVFGFGGVDPSLPLAAFVFLVALGVDYNIFLVSRIRDESVLHGTREGTLRGLAVTGGVITSAGVVLAATFATLTILPQVGSIELGFVVAFGILLDTLLVRTVLAPAITLDLGRRIWWPSRLARRTAEPAGVSAPEKEQLANS